MAGSEEEVALRPESEETDRHTHTHRERERERERKTDKRESVVRIDNKTETGIEEVGALDRWLVDSTSKLNPVFL